MVNSCEFKEIIVFKDFEVKNGVLGGTRHLYNYDNDSNDIFNKI
jgi:hypothetical protein